jgi:transcription elongation factor GreA-like protein/transcription elongation GreA/GreB family factor
MSYLKDFLRHITNHDYPSFLKLWEEYCSGDELDADELICVLKAAKGSSFGEFFGKHVERVLPLWENLPDKKKAHEVFKLIIDIQSTQNPKMGERVFNYLSDLYGKDPYFNEKIRLIGLRNREKFQGSISNYELLSHINKGKFVFHTAGWGVGIILDYSLVREQLVLEFDYVPGKKDLSFSTAFKTLIPLPDDHFLAQRFGNPDELESKAKEDPVSVIRMLLQDLGPKTAADIKDELCDLVIPAADWVKWWQNARTKIKKDTMIETPEGVKGVFCLRDAEMPHEERLQKALGTKPDANTLIQMVYSFMKDFPETLKNAQFKQELASKLHEFLSYPEILPHQKLQIHFFLEDLGEGEKKETLQKLFTEISTPEMALELIRQIQVLSFKKKSLVELRRTHENWAPLFLNLFLALDHGSLRDYVLSELLAEKEMEVSQKLEELYQHPTQYPDTLVWYFQKVISSGKNIPFADREGKVRFFEALLILLSYLEQNIAHKELVKKIHSILTEGRYAIVRQMMQDASQEEVQEFLLLATKCHSLNDHDIKILHSLAEVAHPNLAKSKKKGKVVSQDQENIIWSTEQGYLKLKQRIQQIATVETVENAKEIETARAHGDLRENAEFKAALEKRDRLQGELKLLSEQLNRARILTVQDISSNQVGIGSIVRCKNSQGEEVHYTLLGPWDADPDKNIIAFQSKLAQAMAGSVVGDKFQFQGETFTITKIGSYL